MKTILGIIYILLLNTANAQVWKDMMYDNTYNFYEVCDAAEKHFETHDKNVKGSGWKGYARWRDLNESKYAPSGDRGNIDPVFAAKEYKKFIDKNPTPKAIFGSGWKELGPWDIDSITGHYAAGLGRVEDMYVDPTNSDILYIGSRSGGFWRSLDGGTSWTGTTDFLFASGVNALTARPTNNTDIFINVQNSGNQYSHGVYKSTDSGSNWSQTNFNPSNLGTGGLGSTFKVYELEYHPTITDLVFVGTSQGIYRSNDDLGTWTQLISGSEVKFIRFHPTNPDIIYAYDSRNSNGNRDYVYVSTDAGLSWSLSAQLSGNNDQSGIIQISADCEDCLFFQSSNGIWKSLNQGTSFSFVSDPGEGRGAFIVNDQDTSVMIIGSIDPFATTNGGQNFSQSGYWSLGNSAHGSGSLSENYFQTDVYVHADLRNGKSVNGVIYLTTDGFLTKSSDNGATWEILSQGTPIRENYTLGISQSNHYTTMIGSQDNGTSLLGEDGWVEFYGADGMEAIVQPLNPDWMIGSYQYGGRRRTFDGGLSQSGVNPPGETGSGEADWVAPMAYNPNEHHQIYHYSAEVWGSDEFGDNWYEMGTPASFNGGVIQYAAIAENNSEIMAVSRQSNIELSTDGGWNFTNINGNLPNASIKDIAFDPNDDDVIIVVYNKYQNDGNKVFITYDAGQNWTNITFNINDMPIRSVVIDHTNATNIYVGAEIGVFVMPEGGNTWTMYNSELPNTTVRELEINYGSNTLRAATWGRGMWEYTLKDRIDYPAILTTEITNPPTFDVPQEDVNQFVTAMISYSNTLSSVYTEWSINSPTFGNTINMSNTVDSTWVSETPLPNFPFGTKMFFKVFAVGTTGDTTETYKFMYTVRYNPNASLEEMLNDNIVLYPNPSTGEFSVDLGSSQANIKLTIMSLDGKKVWEQNYTNKEKVNCSVDLARGGYFVIIESEDVNVVRSIIVE